MHGLDNDKYELKLIMAFGVPAETQVIDAIDSNPDGSINYWRDEAQVHHVPKRPLATCCCSCASLRCNPAAKSPQRLLSPLWWYEGRVCGRSVFGAAWAD